MNDNRPQAVAADREAPRGDARATSRRNQILGAAATCFNARGFHGASMVELAREAGMSVGHIYHYFENKEAIIEAIVDRDLDRSLAVLDRISDTEDVADALIAAVREGLSQSCSRKRTLLRLEVLAEASRSPRVAVKVRAADVVSRARYLDILRSQEALSALPEAELAARADTLAALFEGLTLRALRHPEMELDATLESVRPVVRALLCLDGGGEQPRVPAPELRPR